MAPHAAWVRFGWRDAFGWKRFAASFVLGVLPASVCFAQGWGIVGIAVMALGIGPWPQRVSVEAGALVCRWLFIEQRVPFESIKGVQLGPDVRRGALVRPWVLALARDRQRDVLIVAPVSTLRRIAHELRELTAG